MDNADIIDVLFERESSFVPIAAVGSQAATFRSSEHRSDLVGLKRSASPRYAMRLKATSLRYSQLGSSATNYGDWDKKPVVLRNPGTCLHDLK